MWLLFDVILWGGGGIVCNELVFFLGWEFSFKRNGSYEFYVEIKML